MAAIPRGLTYKGIPLWRHTRVIQGVLQVTSGLLVVFLVAWFFLNISGAMRDREIPYGFSFLSRQYQTPIGQHFLPYESSDSFLYAFGVAATNTIVVSIVGVILATALGIFIGVSRMSGNWLVSRAALAYIEFFRNVPLLIQLFFWFYIVLALPQVRQGHVIAEKVYINNGGISLPWPYATRLDAGLVFLGLAIVAIIAGVIVHRVMTRRELMTGATSYPLTLGIVTAVLITVISWLAISVTVGEAPFYISTPVPQGTFGRLAGGFTASGGLIALMLGLVIYTSSFIAEIVRAGIQSVGRGQTEAAPVTGIDLYEYPAQRDLPAVAEGHHPPTDQPVPEPYQEQQSCRRHRLLGSHKRSQDHDPDGASGVHIHYDNAGVPGHEPDILGDWKLVQSSHPLLLRPVRCQPI